MKRAYTFSVLLLGGGVVASSQVSPRSLTSSGAEFASKTYDYIVVGGGTAGLAIAARYGVFHLLQSLLMNNPQQQTFRRPQGHGWRD